MSNFIPNSFQIPNAFVDEALDKVSGNACKIYLLIVRKTRGWNKEADRISFSQIQKATGIGSSATVDKCLKELLDFGLINVKTGNEKLANKYSLNDDFTILKNKLATLENKVATSKTKVPSTSKNEVATSKTEVQGTSKTEDTENNSFKTTREKTSEKRSHDFSNQISENQKPSVDEVFEFLKNSQVIPVFGNYQPNVVELSATIEEVCGFWSNKNFNKQQLLAKILSSLIHRCGSASRVFEVVAIENKPQEKPLNVVQFVSPFDVAKQKLAQKNKRDQGV